METPALHQPSRSAATLAGVGAIVLWSFSGVCYAVGGRGMHPMVFLCLSSATGVLTIVLLRLVRRKPVLDLFRVPPRVIAAGLFGIVLYSLLLATATGSAAPEDVAYIMLLNYLWPIWIILLGIGLLNEKVRVPQALLGAALGFAGVLIARGTQLFRVPPAHLAPHAMAAIGGVLWALYSVLLRRWRIPAERGGSTFHFVILALVSGLIAAFNGSWPSPDRIDALALFFTIFAGIGPVGLGYYWWEIGVKRGAVHLLAVLSYFIPIASTVLIGCFYHQAVSPILFAGAALIAAGAWIGARAPREGRRGEA